MTIRQEDNTPIGDFFHDNGLLKIFEKIESVVDDFEVDTDSLTMLIDTEIDKLKSLKAQVKKVEQAWAKKQHNREVADMVNVGLD